MTTCDPPLELFRRQVDSIRAQTHTDWVCVVSDDCSAPERFAAIQEVLGDDPRFVLSRIARRLGFYRNFERALALAPADAAYVASPTRTIAGTRTSSRRCWPSSATRASSTATRAWSRATAACSPTATGAGARTTTRACCRCWWPTRSPAPRRCSAPTCCEDALSFPPAQFAHFHDHWLALVALSLGDIAFVERPLYDYVQHGDATLGHAAANRMPGMRERARRAAARPARARAAVADALLRRRLPAAAVRRRAAAALRVADGGGQAPRPRPASSAPTARSPRSRGSPGAARRSCSGAAATRSAPSGCSSTRSPGAACSPPPPATGRPASGGSTRCRRRRSTRDRERARPRSRRPAPSRRRSRRCGSRSRDDAPRRINLLVPSIDLQHFFGGYIGKFNFARRLAARGVRVRIVTVDPVALFARVLARGRRGLQRARRAAGRGRGRVRARVAGPGGQPRGRLRRDDLVDRPRRARGAADARARRASST